MEPQITPSIPQTPQNPLTLAGFRLNKVYCMDALEGLKKLPAESISAIITDPPYNTGMNSKSQSDFNNGWKSAKKPWLFGFFNDNYSKKDYRLLVKGSCNEFYRILKNNKPAYIFINFKSYPIWYNNLKRAGFKVKNVIIWDKVVHGLNYQNYAYCYEMIIYAIKGDFKLNKSPKYYKDVWSIRRKLQNPSNVFHHETEKPFILIKEIINQCSKENDIILDAYVGGGNIIISIKKLNRNFIGFEINPKYVEITNGKLSQHNLSKYLEQRKL